MRWHSTVVPSLVASLLIFVGGCALVRVGGSDSFAAEEINARKARARELIDAGEYKRAIGLLLPLGARDVKDSQIYSMLGEAFWKSGAYDDAVTQFEKALRLEYSGWRIHLHFAEMLMEMGKIGRALTEFELATGFGGREPLAHYNFGLALYETGRRDRALEQWEIAYSLDEQSARYAEAMAIGYSGRNDPKARQYFERAAGLGADSPSFHNNYGLVLTRLKDFALAEEHLQAAVNSEPRNELYRFNLALLYMNAKDHDSAIPLWETLLSTSPDNHTYRIYLGKAYLEKSRFQDAIALLEPWLKAGGALGETRPPGPADEAQPGLDEAYGVLAMSFRGIGELGRAIGYITRALELRPRSTIHLNNYGVILAEDGKIREAKAQWEKVLRLDPDNAAAKQNLSAFRR